MSQSLTPYMLTIAPIILIIGFFLHPVPDEIYGQEYLDQLKDADQNMVQLSAFLVFTGIICTIGSFFLLSQDMMPKVGKMQQDMLMLARVAFVVPLVVFSFGIGAELEMYWLLTEDGDSLTAEEEDALAMDLHLISSHIWASMPLGLGLALALVGAAGLVGKDLSANANTFGFGLPLLIGLGLFTVYFTNAWIFILFAPFAGVPIGVMMLMGKLEV